MILGKTQYLCELESLCEEYSRYVESSTGYRGVYKLPLLILLTRSLRKAEAVGEELRDHLFSTSTEMSITKRGVSARRGCR